MRELKVPPRIAAMWLVLGVAVLIAGWTESPVSLGDTASEQPQTRTVAAEVNLRTSDAPGFKLVLAEQGEEEAPPGPLRRQAEECYGGPVLDAASRGVISPILQTQATPIETVFSAVYPTPDPATAMGYIRAADSPRGLRCSQREEDERHNQAGLPGIRRRVEVDALRPPLGGASVSGVRVWSCLAGPRPCKDRRVRSVLDRIWFTSGAYMVTLFYIVIQSEAKSRTPIALPIERHLVGRLLGRAEGRVAPPTELTAPAGSS